MIWTAPRLPFRAALAAAVLGACTAVPMISLADAAEACVVEVRSATTDVLLLDADAARLAGKIRARLLADDEAGRLAGQHIAIAITNYDKGSNTVRSMVRGPNDIHADLVVTVRKAGDAAPVRSLTVRETFSAVVDGSASRISDIEDGLVKAVADALGRQG